ncbi:MAG: TolC family protein [Fimbriimonadaceae bacterium]
MFRASFISLFTLSLASVFAQQSLSLEAALDLAKRRNGTIIAAQRQVDAARARVNQARSAFLPTLTPSFSYSDSKTELNTGAPVSPFTTIRSGTTSEITAAWKVLDSGTRGLTFLSARKGYDAEFLDATQTLRSTLFDVFTQYYEVIRGQELLKVSEAQIDRAEKSVKQTEAQIKVGDAAEKDIYQPRADFLNAKVQLLTNRNRLAKSIADFKAALGWDDQEPLPALEPSSRPVPEPLNDRASLVKEGLGNRADLAAQRLRLDQQVVGLRRTKLDAGIQFSLDLSLTKTFGQDNSNDRLLTFSASAPLFDGHRSKEAIKEGEANLRASESTLKQQERSVRAAIESAYDEVSLNAERLEAAEKALEAARINYQKTDRAKELGAAGVDVVTLSVAQVTLAQAENAYVEAIYDYYISRERLGFVVGRPVRGEG